MPSDPQVTKSEEHELFKRPGKPEGCHQCDERVTEPQSMIFCSIGRSEMYPNMKKTNHGKGSGPADSSRLRADSQPQLPLPVENPPEQQMKRHEGEIVDVTEFYENLGHVQFLREVHKCVQPPQMGGSVRAFRTALMLGTATVNCSNQLPERFSSKNRMLCSSIPSTSSPTSSLVKSLSTTARATVISGLRSLCRPQSRRDNTVVIVMKSVA